MEEKNGAVYKSYRDMVWQAIEEEVGRLEDNSAFRTFGLVKWLSEDDCKEFCRIYEIEGEVDPSLEATLW